MRSWRYTAFVAATVTVACGPDVHFETLKEDCHTYCRNLLVDCVPPELRVGEVEGCADDCEDDAEDSLDQGHKCAQSFEDLLSCIVPLTCTELADWQLDRTGNECEAETAGFRAECSKLWVAYGE